MSINVSEDAIRSALTFIPADDRDLWLRIGMALKSEFGDTGFAMFEEWSQAAENFDIKAVKSTWKSFKLGGGVTIATLIAEAKQRGFDPKRYAPSAPLSSEEREAMQRTRKERDRAAAAEVAAKQEAAMTTALKTWSAAAESGESSYLVRKAITGYGVRYASDSFLVPLLDETGKLWNVQQVFADGKKRFLQGGRVSGCFHIIGDIVSADWVLVAEGYATAATLHEALGCAVVVAFNANNIKHVVRVLHQKYPTAKLLICADDDRETETRTGKNPGIIAAMEAAEAVGGYWCKPDALPDGGTDYNDLAIASGLDTVRAQIAIAMDAANIQASPAVAAKVSIAGTDKSKRKKTPPASAKGASGGEAPAPRPFFRVDEGGVWYHG